MRCLLTSISALSLIAVGATALSAPAMANHHEEAEANAADAAVDALIEEVWQYNLSQSPIFASALGVDGYEGQISNYSLEARSRNAAQAQTFLDRLMQIDEDALSADGKVNFGILRRDLTETIEGNSFGQRVINFTNRSGWHQGVAGWANNSPFRNAADYRSYLDRLAQYATINDQSIAVANMAIEGGYTLPCDAMTGYEGSISGLMAEDVTASRYYEPFTRSVPSSMTQDEFDTMAAEAREIISGTIYPELQEHYDWYTSTYAPACSVAPGISAQPGGADYYAYRIRSFTTTEMTAQEIHDLGLSEVARIRAEMEEVAAEAGFDSREAFIEHLRTDPQYYADTPEELMRHVARMTKRIDGMMPSLFGTLPRLPYGIREIPAETAEGTTTAYYNPGSPEIGIAGTYYVNTSLLDQRPLWEVPALSVHEAVPGHHHQIALQQELDLSDYRRNGAFFTAFVEGWGLYSERLGIEMGLYDTPETNMGRLSYEMWRACRLVVDTGVHAFGWEKQRAIEFMADNTALSDANIEAEVNRYISWPGQALAYKIGELTIRRLRTQAEEALGGDFDLRQFHDAVLTQGAVPLDVLEAQFNDWIASEQERLAAAD